jgi:selenocysteine lyase/cysteine desulfurase
VRHLGRIRPIDVLGQVDESTRLVALASCHFISGWRIELDAIGRLLHERRILFAVDGIQTLGAFPTPVTHVDFLAADAHKWLLGPLAAGILYVRKDRQEMVKPLVHGWANLECPDYIPQTDLKFRPGARRYEAGSGNILGIAGLHAGLKLLDEVGIDAIAAELLRKRALLVDGLMAKGWGVLLPEAPATNASAIVSFWGDEAETRESWEKLRAAGVQTALRSARDGKKFIRVSPHFYNTDAELHRMLELV